MIPRTIPCGGVVGHGMACGPGLLCEACQEISALRSGEMKAWAPLVLGWALAHFTMEMEAGRDVRTMNPTHVLDRMNEDLFGEGE